MLESHCSNQAERQHMVTQASAQPLETNLRMILSLLQIPCSVLEWKGFRHQRVLRSILPLQKKRHLWTGRKMQRIVAEACWQKLYNLYTLMHGPRLMLQLMALQPLLQSAELQWMSQHFDRTAETEMGTG
jgi:hypothetical protein